MSERQDPLTSADEVPNANAPARLKDLTELQRIIARGFDVEAFMNTDMGRYIQARASRELEEAQDALLDVDANNPAAVRALQLEGRVAARVLTYFADMRKEAEAAEEQHAQVFAEAQQGQD